ncbi:hypothetical protein L6452_15068 [Arctium lappa]|uniref:Uncharacterized protein n=1 Tax=Arctium lappa TaxID=4217 RepID=A0ACB9CMN6_ARCLA|nr:hypothetical protein L6452_15068 [Arctium lappa]
MVILTVDPLQCHHNLDANIWSWNMSDVNSYGMVLWDITTEKIPWDNLNSMQLGLTWWCNCRSIQKIMTGVTGVGFAVALVLGGDGDGGWRRRLTERGLCCC